MPRRTPEPVTIEDRIDAVNECMTKIAHLTQDQLNRDDLAEAVSELDYLATYVRLLERQVVAAARVAGAPWTQLARRLGVTPQAVQQRFGHSGGGS